MTTHKAGIGNGGKQATGSLTDNDGAVWRMLDSAMHIDDDSDVMHCVRVLIRVSIGFVGEFVCVSIGFVG